MAKKSKAANAVLVFTKSATTEIRAEFSEYKGKMLLNIREWFGDSDDDTEDYKPGKGFTVPVAKAGDFIAAFVDWAENVVVPDAEEEIEIKKGSRVVLKNGEEGVVKKIKDDVAFVIIDGDDDDELTRMKLSKLELAPEKAKKSKKKDKGSKSKKSANDEADEELVDLDDDAPKKSSMKGGVKVSKKDNQKIDKKAKDKKKAKKKARSL